MQRNTAHELSLEQEFEGNFEHELEGEGTHEFEAELAHELEGEGEGEHPFGEGEGEDEGEAYPEGELEGELSHEFEGELAHELEGEDELLFGEGEGEFEGQLAHEHGFGEGLVRSGLYTVYETLERPLPAVLAGMEEAGILVDPSALRRLSHEWGARMGELEAQAHALAGHPFNLGSPKQIGDVLFGEQGLPGGRKTATGAWSTDADTLESLSAGGHPLPLTILEHRQLAKLKGTYADALIFAAHPRDGRVRTTFMLANSSTGRLSATEPNLQNIPIRTEVGRQLRTVFVAAPGNVLISADYSQIELRLLAHVGDIPQLKAAFAAGVDIHAATASEMFGVPIEGMPSQTRSRAKAINFGIVYGISAFGLSNQLGIPQDEAGAYIKTYFERFPGIRAYMDEQRGLVKQRGWVETLFGRRIHIPDIRSKSMGQRQAGERQAINAPIQGAAADIIRRAMARMPAALRAEGLEARMLLQVHDELVFEAPEAEAPRVCEVARRVMFRAAEPAVALSVPLEVDARAARNWDEAH